MSWINKLHETLSEILKIEENEQIIGNETINYLNKLIENTNITKKPILYCASFGGFSFSKIFYDNFIGISENNNDDIDLIECDQNEDRKYYNEVLQYGQSIYNINWHFIHLTHLIDHYTTNDNKDELINWFENKFKDMYANKELPVYYENSKHLKYMITDFVNMGHTNTGHKFYSCFIQIPVKYLTKYTIQPHKKYDFDIDYDKNQNDDNSNEIITIAPNEVGVYIYYNDDLYPDESIVRKNNLTTQTFVDDINAIVEQSINNANAQQDKYNYWYNPITNTYHHISDELKNQLIEKIGLMCASGPCCKLAVEWIADYAIYTIDEYDGTENIVIKAVELNL